jgi:hypothetical protein
VDEHVSGLMHVGHVVVARALAALADLHDQFSSLSELQDHVVAAAGPARFRPPSIAADPDEVLRIDEDSVLPFRPVEALAVAAPACQQLAGPIELEHRRCGLGTLRFRDRSRPVQHPDVIARIHGDRRHFAQYPIVRNRRPGRIDLECRRTPLALSRCRESCNGE